MKIQKAEESSSAGNELPEIPIIAVTGTNGKTTTTRMISRILRRHGYNVGMTTTHGIFINDKCIEEGDTTGPKSAKKVLSHSMVGAAVLETARGGIIRSGLGYGKSDVSVFTNMTGDHLGIDGINTMEELLEVKSHVISAVKNNGTSVLNADDNWVMKAKAKATGNILLFSMDSNNPYILDQRKDGGRAVFAKDGRILAAYGGITRRVLNINEIPATLNGALKHNIYNSMAAIGACLSLGIKPYVIERALHNFTCDADVNPGRFNMHDLGDFMVVLDYGHNIDGYKVTIEGIKSMNPSRIIGIIGVPGDRRNEDIINVGKTSGESFNKIIIKEDRDTRGRYPGEVADILKDGAVLGGIEKENISIILDEEEALIKALEIAEKGDIIVVFFEKMEPLAALLNNHSNKAVSKKERELAMV